jgi:hypothetical protein
VIVGRFPRIGVSLAGCLLVASGLPTGASAMAASDEALTLGRVNVIKGTAASVIDVRIPVEASVRLTLRPHRKNGPSRSLRLQGAGRAVGVALTPPPPVEGPLFGSSRFLISGRFGQCPERACDPQGEVLNFQQPSVFPGGGGDGWHKLAPGDYRLYLIADGAPVRIRLELRGLQGRIVISPRAPGPIDLKTPTVRAATLGGPSYYAAGDVFEAGSRGLAMTMLSLRGPRDPLYSAYGACGYWSGSINLPQQAAYGPHCFGTGMGGLMATWNDAKKFYAFFLQGYSEPDFPPTDGSETRGHGVWVVSRNPLSKVVSQIFTLALD